MKFTKTEKILLGVSVWGLLLLLLYPHVDFSGALAPTQEPYAVLTPEGGDVRAKDSSAFDWQDVRKTVGVEENSRIFTGGTSRAKLKFKDGAEMSVQEQTLIVVSKGAQDARIVDVQQGMVYFDLPGNGQEVMVRIGNRVEKIKGTGARVKLENKDGKVAMTLVSGRAEVGEGKAAQVLTQSQAKLDLTDAGPARVPELKVVSPPDGGIFWKENPQIPVKLAWSADPGKTAVVVLKRTEDGQEVGRYESSTGAVDVPELVKGDYSWELRDQTGELQSSTRFRVRPLEPPRIEAVRSEDGTIRLAWVDESLSENFEVKITEASGEGKTVFSTSTRDLNAQTGILPRGTYALKVMSFRADRPEPILSSATVTHFHDNVTAPAATAVTLAEKAFNFELVWPGTQKATPGFEAAEQARVAWRSDVPSPMYHVQFARDYSFEKLVHEGESRESIYEWKDAPAGKWYARVRPRGGLGDDSPWSDVSQLRVIFAPPVMTAISKAEGDAAINVSWDSHPRVERFEIVSADNPAFTSPIQKLTDKRYEEMPLERNGKFYARVRGLDKNGWPVTSWSDPAVYLPGGEQSLPLGPQKLAERQPEDGPANSDQQTLTAKVEDPIWKTFRRVVRVWSGFGLNYFRLGQSANSDLQEATFSNFTGPTLMGEVMVGLKNMYNFVLGYHDQPGRIENSAFGLTLDNSRWQTITFDVGAPWAEVDFGDRPVKIGWRGGLMRHRFPFIFYDGAVRQVFNDLNSISAGVEAEMPLDRRWSFESFLRYQYPLSATSSAGTIAYTSNLSFDGSVGLVRKLSKSWMMGLYWFGQSQNMKYRYQSTGTDASGTQNFFNSNVQVRVGYELLTPVDM